MIQKYGSRLLGGAGKLRRDGYASADTKIVGWSRQE